MKKYTTTQNAQRKRNYNKTAIYKPNKWTPAQDELVLAHEFSDTELSSIIGNSVQAIQNRRWRLKKLKK